MLSMVNFLYYLQERISNKRQSNGSLLLSNIIDAQSSLLIVFFFSFDVYY